MDYLAEVMDLAWFAATAVAVIFCLVCEIRQHRKGGGFRQTLVVLLALIILFPSLSTRDDLIGLAFLSPRANQGIQPALESQAASDFQLGIHLLELDHFLVTSLHAPPVNNPLVAGSLSAISLFTGHSPLHQAGRAPPLPI